MRHRLVRALLATVAVALVAVACTSPSDDDATDTSSTTTTSAGPSTSDDGAGDDPVAIDDGIRIEVVSSQPDRATGPDARIRVTPADGGDPADLVVTLDDQDVTAALTPVNGALEGVIVGLVEGTNTLRAHARSQPEAVSTQRVRSWPLSGPMISGPHRPLLACSTEANGLGAPTDANCSAPTRVSWSYVTTDGAVADLVDPAARPADLADVEVDGETVPFILRRETGVLNRSVYDIVTVDPSPEGSDNDQSDVAWNRRLIYRFGGGCVSSHGQGAQAGPLFDVRWLSQGYATATATFNNGDVQCNDVVSAETTMMVKERFIELFGVPDHTIGEGRGGGAVQTVLLAQNYPGLLDGAVGTETFPDFLTVLSNKSDCVLLERWFASPAGSALAPNQRKAVNGHATGTTCTNWANRFPGLLDPTVACDPAIDPAALYDAATNPAGLRCTFQDEAINVFGADPLTGAARRPLDNVGVQYGLGALNDGVITFAQFVALNREIGGIDADGAPQPLRHEADPEAVALAYETGRVSAAAGDQRKIPLIVIDLWADPSGDLYDHVRPFSLRDRLTAGRSPAAAPGFQVWTREEPSIERPDDAVYEALAAMDEWLSNLEGDTTGGSREEVLERNRPTEAGDNCTVPGRPEPVYGLHLYDEESECSDRYPMAADPRMVAGAPLANDVVKCNLKSVDSADYEQEITERQYGELLEVFPTGVCDWEVPGVGQTAPSMSDRTFEDVVTPEQLA